MKEMRNIAEAEQVLAAYVPQVNEFLGQDVTLERIGPLMAMLDNPQDKLKIIHIAGTSGKTSTAYYLASLLQASGQKVGLTVSPHLDSVTERVQINLEPLPDAEFCQALSEFLEIIESYQPEPTYFELLIAFAYWYFAKAGVDYAVIETGLGGTFDATNVAGNSDKVCVITDIGYDHMQILGKELADIAGQKAGIIKHGNQVFTYGQSPAVMRVFEQVTKEQNAILNVLSDFDELSREVKIPQFAGLPAYQQRNWLLAKHVYDFVTGHDSLPALNLDQIAKSTQIQVPGRMDMRQVGSRTLIMDGAHNEQKMQAFVDSFQALYPGKKAAIILALKEGKEYQTVLPLLLPICNHLIITTFDVLQDLPTRSIDSEILARAAKESGFSNVSVIKNPAAAYKELLKAQEDLLVITGSFYLLSCVRPAIIEHDD